jgi:hypothetical protein
LPDQIDGMNYTAHFFADLACCVKNSTYDRHSISLTGTHSYDARNNPFSNILSIDVNSRGSNTIYIKDQIIVEANADITLTGLRIFFAPGAKVIIKRGEGSQNGGRLRLVGCTLTADRRCGPRNLWEGIEVWGHQNESATSSRQGRLFTSALNNRHTLIEFARIGVSTFQRGVSPITGGGTVVSTNTVFKDNILCYSSGPKSLTGGNSFTRCSFIATSDAPTWQVKGSPSEPALTLASVNDHNGVTFQGCLFEDQRTGLQDVGFNGIISNNSKINVVSHCSVMITINQSCPQGAVVKGEFRNLMHGIAFSTSNDLRTAFIDNCLFVNNRLRGISIIGGASSVVTNNRFEIPSPISNNQSHFAAGLYLEKTTGFTVTENSFLSTGSGVNERTRGVVVTNSERQMNFIYKNNFSNLQVGGHSQGQNDYREVTNGQVHNSSGLVWQCNKFENQFLQADLAVTSLNLQNAGINFLQGNCPINDLTTAAGNQFSFSSHEIHMATDVRNIQYQHHRSQITTPIIHTSNVLPMRCENDFDERISCPTILNRTRRQIKDRISILEAGIREKKERFEATGNPHFYNEYRKLKADKDTEIEALIRNFIHSPEVMHPADSIIGVLRNEPDLHWKKRLAFTYLEKGDLYSANEMISEIRDEEGNGPFTELAEIHMEIYNSGLPVKEAINENNNLLQRINQLAFDNNAVEVSGKAVALLNLSLDTIIPRIIEPLNIVRPRNPRRGINNSQQTQGAKPENSTKDALLIYPNPTADFVTINFNLDVTGTEGREEVVITIFNAMGKQVYSEKLQQRMGSLKVDTSKLTSGIYFINVTAEGVETAREKLIITK